MPLSSHTVPPLKDQSLFKDGVAYINGKWVKAKSGKTFEVQGVCALGMLDIYLGILMNYFRSCNYESHR